MVSVRTHLWFGHDRAREAAEPYAAHIPESWVDRVITARGGEGEPVAGIVGFTVAGQPVTGLSAGPHVRLDEAFSCHLPVDGQEEVDHSWDLLTADGGETSQCGWCKDRSGVSWQVIPRQSEELSGDDSTPANQEACQAMLGMTRIDVAALQAAYDGTA